MPKQNNIPTVPLKAFIKHSLEILQNPLPFHLQNFEKLGDIFRLKIGLTNSVFFSRNAALAEYVLQKNQKNYKKSKIQTQDLAKYVGTGLLTAEGEHWRTQRRLIQPAFHKKQLNKLTESINNAISEEYSKITPYTVVNVFPVFNDLAFQTVVKSLFSSAVDQNSINRLQYITEAAQRMMVKELRQPYLGWWFTASGKIKKHIDLTIEARQILKTIVNERKSSGKRADDLLDMLLDAKYDDGSAMQEAQLLDEILILFTAGHETTANALTFTCQLLAQHPEWQDKIFDEVTSNKNQGDDLMTTLSASKLCKAVIEESMRLYPPAYFIDRVNIEADTFDGMHFEPDSNLLFSVYEIHRHPELWEQPNAFLPQRFLDGSQKFSSQYFPFGAGPRKCIGNNFAMFEMIVAINQLVSKFKIYPHFKTIGITPLITLKPKNANLRFEER
ncbi:cytochrome P450 [Jejuia pallidilutea]|uniref:Cytochrome P450 hydroxylase n=1 Tax=Jejuia pallidilutea TaxID=504487 RepID=A0A090WEK9_9FLAO|nr:cytochrome P450 [Jejuia pallidilutea]GAL65947.1 cytochrome P450 hydroxylase [Jejuia pallidilutea]GAL70654.1 cytochrome P450 hydroxylase [Jejuia pallidilutea]GAL88017.1 cytochrome P450 hydroxylase [Jejuia pallidilutea]